MAAYIARRLMWVPFLLVIVTFITFALGRFGPGDPVQVLMGQYSNPEAVQRIRQQRGLDDNVFAQYSRYVRDIFRGDFGESFKYRGRTVGELIQKRIGVSVQLGLAALIISLGLGIPLGLFAALKQGTWMDTGAVTLALVGQSLPVFLTAPSLLLIFALKLKLLPTHGWGGILDTRVILPAIVIGNPGGRHCDQADPGQHPGCDQPGLRPHRPRQGTYGTTGAATPHPAQRLGTGLDQRRLFHGRAGQRRRDCRDLFRYSGNGFTGGGVTFCPRLPGDHGLDHHRD